MTHVEPSIGVLDSGMGGLSVLAALIKAMPRARFTYAADHAGLPWGDKSPNTIRGRAKKLLDKLLSEKPDCVVFACNTATLVAMDDLQSTTTIPLIGVRPQDLFQSTLVGPIGIMATQASILSRRYRAQKEAFQAQHPELELWDMPCPGLMEFVERGELTGALLEAFLRAKFQQVPPLKTCLLSCTHYPFLRASLERLNPNTTFLDPSLGVVDAVSAQLQYPIVDEASWPAHVEVTFWSTDPAPSRDRVLQTLLAHLSPTQAYWQKF